MEFSVYEERVQGDLVIFVRIRYGMCLKYSLKKIFNLYQKSYLSISRRSFAGFLSLYIIERRTISCYQQKLPKTQNNSAQK